MRIILLIFLLVYIINANDRFIIKNNVVIDTTTEFIWQKNTNRALISYDEAKEYCSRLQVGEFDNWRIPTITELMTLSTKNNETEVYIDLKDGFYWSSSEYKGDDSKVWLIDFHNEFSSKYYKDSNANIICIHN